MADDTRQPASIPETAFEATFSLTELSPTLKSRIVRAIAQELGGLGGPIATDPYNKVTYEKPGNGGGYKKVVHEKNADPFTKNLVPEGPGEISG